MNKRLENFDFGRVWISNLSHDWMTIQRDHAPFARRPSIPSASLGGRERLETLDIRKRARQLGSQAVGNSLGISLKEYIHNIYNYIYISSRMFTPVNIEKTCKVDHTRLVIISCQKPATFSSQSHSKPPQVAYKKQVEGPWRTNTKHGWMNTFEAPGVRREFCNCKHEFSRLRIINA